MTADKAVPPCRLSHHKLTVLPSMHAKYAVLPGMHAKYAKFVSGGLLSAFAHFRLFHACLLWSLAQRLSWGGPDPPQSMALLGGVHVPCGACGVRCAFRTGAAVNRRPTSGPAMDSWCTGPASTITTLGIE